MLFFLSISSISIILTRINLTVENVDDGIAPPDAGNSTVNRI